MTEYVTDPELIKTLNNKIPRSVGVTSFPVKQYVTDESLISELNKKKQEVENKPYAPPAEGLGTALFQAPGRIAEDVGKAGWNVWNSLPGMINEAPSEIKGFAAAPYTHPISMLKQEAAGGAELINKLSNMPANILNYLANSREQGGLNLLPKSIPQALTKVGLLHDDDISDAIKQMFDEPKYPGEKLGRGIARNLDVIYGGAKLNPGKLTAGSVAKNIDKVARQEMERYSGPRGYYERLFNRADQQGVGTHPLAPNQINLPALEQNATVDQLHSLNQAITNPSLRTYQDALHDLGDLTRELEGRKTLLSHERDTLNAAREARRNIQQNMFRDTNGNINERFLAEHRDIQNGYRRDVIPYRDITYNGKNALQEYRAGKLRPEKLMQAAKEDPFYVQKSGSHIPLMIRNNPKKAGLLIASPLAYSLANTLYRDFLGTRNTP